MHLNRAVTIAIADNGFVIECRVPIKPKEKKNSDKMCCDYPGSSEKQYIAKDADEVATIIQKLMPMLDDKFTSEEEFDAAFKQAAK